MHSAGAYPGSIAANVQPNVPLNVLPPAPSRLAGKLSAQEPPISDWDSYFITSGVQPARRRAALTRHFRYKMIPWMEAGDPLAHFGVDMMHLSQEHPPIEAAVLEVSAVQLSLTQDAPGTGDGWGQGEYASVNRQIQTLDGPLRRTGEAVLSLDRFFRFGPSRWREHSMYEMDEVTGDVSAFTVEEPMQTLCKLHSRIGEYSSSSFFLFLFSSFSFSSSSSSSSSSIARWRENVITSTNSAADLASSIILRKPPLTSTSFYSPSGIVDAWETKSPKVAYDQALYYLTISLHFIHDGTQPLPYPFLHDPRNPSIQSLISHSTLSSKWLALWKSCQTWRERRPLPLRPIVEVGNMEAGRIDSMALASFPIHLYTSALAIQANVVYHMTSLLLLAHKPRLLKLSGYPHHLTSQSFHVQGIAGIATTNEFAEQWDPILVAALLHIARDMTHQSQQMALRRCFHSIRVGTGINLDRELNDLEAHWSVGRAF